MAVVEEALQKKDHIRELIKLGEGDRDMFRQAFASMRAELGLRSNDNDDALLDDLAGILSDDDLKAAAAALIEGSKNDRKLADGFSAAFAAGSGEARAEALRGVFMTAKGTVRASRTFITKASREAHPALAALLDGAKERFFEKWQALRALRVAKASEALLRLAEAVLSDYEAAKAMRAQLDFDDLIIKTAELFSSRSATSWVLYKLDGGIDHILVDEAQDTSPRQWQLVASLADEFFAGDAGREGEDRPRTVFAVGDEKQSIYSFQGAVPAKFAAMGRDLKERALNARVNWHDVPLTLSFRSTSTILQAVDAVFSNTGEI